MLVAIVYMYYKTGSFAIADFQNVNFSHTESQWISGPSWLLLRSKFRVASAHLASDAHTEAPAGGSVVLRTYVKAWWLWFAAF